MQRLQSKNFLAGVSAMLIGLFVIAVTSDYGFGTPRRMGPGFFPMILGGLLTVIGLLITLGSGRDSARFPKVDIRAYVAITLAILAFAILVSRIGFGPAGIVTLLLAGAADRGSNALHLLLLAVTIVPAVWLLFSVGLGVQVPFVMWRF
ncbi:tripartite tricarboxylate transporter TctB family protein [Paracoccus hibiscisoli]|uniref:tripartite tricarboxylate transporter TctB family protein n=1 Tax=Paracoccus hibiscisoli TaxID=2023261 RepID=UPI0023F121C5|nr:tripartite tricarboxylate transporter TctB family protein [Paracoccus hibiscisoli]